MPSSQRNVSWTVPADEHGRPRDLIESLHEHDALQYYGTPMVEVVPANQLAGAVEALRQIGTDHVQADGTRGPLSALVAQRVARDALDRLGGQ